MNRFTKGLSMGLILALASTSGLSQVPSLINYQGRLVDGTNLVNGNVMLGLRLYDASVAGLLLYEDTSTVVVIDGLYSTLLGDSTASGDIATALTNAQVWLETVVNGTPLQPRERLASVPFALSAATAPGTLVWQTVAGTNVQALPNRGYLLTNSGTTVVTLPTAANVGDIVRISSSGVGDWRISQNAGQHIKNAHDESVPWTAHESSRNWEAIASSADGMKLAAVAWDGQIYVSTDGGESWAGKETNRQWTAIALSADGSKLVATEFSGQIYCSSNSGLTWVGRETNRSWRAVASSADGTRLLAAAQFDGIYISADSGESWLGYATNQDWRAVASSSDGSTLVIANKDSTIFTSWNYGTNWVLGETNQPWTSVASSADGTKLVAATDYRKIYTSSNSGATWIPCESGRRWSGVATSSDGKRLVAVALAPEEFGDFSGGDHIYISSDAGITWMPYDSARYWQSVASSADGTRLVAVAKFGQIYTSPRQNSQVGAGGYLVGGPEAAIELQYVGSGQFITISHEGIITAH